MELSVNSSSDFEAPRFCIFFKSKILFTSWVIVYALCIPIFVLVLYVGYRKRRSGHVSHSDAFTFNIIAVEMCAIMASILILCGLYIDKRNALMEAGISLMYINSIGQVFFHCLTCVERYLAVVHPVTYMSLKKGGAVTLRNISIAFVWMVSSGYVTLKHMVPLIYQPIMGILLPSVALALVAFCSVSVLRVLIRPKPGGMGGNRKGTDQSKRTAFNTITVIMGALLVRLVTDVFYFSIKLQMVNGVSEETCIWSLSVLWFGLPNSLVLPLLFLHRRGTVKDCIKFCKRSK